MKAYNVYDPNHWEGYQDIIFAPTVNEAKKKALSAGGSCQDAEWINLRAVRIPYLDDMEKLTEKEIMYVAILHGWWHEVDGVRYDEENIDEAIANGVVTPYKALEQSE